MKNEYEKYFLKNRFTMFASEERQSAIGKFAWAIPNAEALAECTKYCPLVEIGAGTGYWAHLINGTVHTYDIDNSTPGSDTGTWSLEPGHWALVKQGGPNSILSHPDCNLLLCWPPYQSSMAHQCLRNFKNKFVIYIGESHGGCNADDEFFELLYTDYKIISRVIIPQWPGIHDYLAVFERK